MPLADMVRDVARLRKEEERAKWALADVTKVFEKEIAEVLEEIAAVERRPGYEGPTITGYISSVAAMQDLMVRGGGDFMPKVIEDAIVGAVGRASDQMEVSGPWPSGLTYAVLVVSDRCIKRWGESRALAALRAWEEAIGGDNR